MVALGISFVETPAQGHARTTDLEAGDERQVAYRVSAIRARMATLEAGMEFRRAKGDGSLVAQWYNWPNWPNFWRDWRPWPNWGWSNY